LNLNPDYSDGTVQCVYAGVDIEKQKTSLQNIPTILIGTPNRLFDLYNSNSFDISRLQTLIVDEIDKIVEPLGKYSNVKQRFNKKIHPLVGELLLEMIISQRKIESKKTIGVGFLSDPAKSKPLQFIASSATVNNPLRNYLKKRKWTERPVLLDLNSNPPSEVQHLAYYFDQQGKIHQVSSDGCIKDIQLDETISGLEIIAEAIGSICHSHKVKRGMIVVPPSVSITTLVSHLQSIGLSAEKLFNLHDYNHQTKPFEALINGNVNLVCATETEIRGLDIPELDHVIIVGATNSQSYLHVSGRTGRFGRFGTCISLLPPKFVERYLKMLQLNGIKIKEPLPTPLKHEIVPSWF
jgi:superfamily II DNA/RNA helicase